MNITVQISGVENIEKKLSRLGNSIYKLPDSFKQIGQFLVNYYANDVFESRGSKIGPRWADLAASTRRYKFNHYRAYTNVPLIATGTMQKSFVFEAGESSLKVGNETDYFKYHEFGTSRMPQRKMMGFNSTIKQEITNIIKKEIAIKLGSV